MIFERLSEEFKNGTVEVVGGAAIIVAGVVLESTINHAIIGGFLAGGAVMLDGFSRINDSRVE